MDLEEAKQVIEENRQVRLTSFQLELEALCKKYNCSLTQGQVIVTAN